MIKEQKDEKLISLFFIIVGLIMVLTVFLLATNLQNKEYPEKVVDCYDKYNNKIDGVFCYEKQNGFILEICTFFLMIGLLLVLINIYIYFNTR